MRWLPDGSAEEPTSTLVLNAGGRDALYTDFRPLLGTRPMADCEWAFAGKKILLPGGTAQWTRIVDSRGETGTVDEAMCTTLEDGTELECGEMVNPDTEKVQSYEEKWRDEEITDGAIVQAFLHEDQTCPGVQIRVGDWVQGVVQGPDGSVSAQRWKLINGEWVLDASYGTYLELLPTPEQQRSKIAGWVAEESYIYCAATDVP